MIDTKYLHLILAINKHGSLNKASKELNLTQSALSHQLKNLESLLGVELFYREKNQLLFTEAGKELRDRSEKIVEDLERLRLRMLEIREDQLKQYIHGYSKEEAKRLNDQATSVSEFLHYDSIWDEGSKILEVGCGVGAQTEIIARKNSGCQIVSIDIAEESIMQAKEKIQSQGIENVEFVIADVRTLAHEKGEVYDHIFICFLLEHLANPLEILQALKKILKPGGTITVIEGDHGSTFFYPDNKYARRAVRSQVEIQEKRGGNANIGREIYPLLDKAEFKNIEVSPRQIYVDGSKPKLVEGFIKNTFTAMIKGVMGEIVKEGIMTKSEVERGLSGLLRTAERDGVFSYTFFKGRAVK